MASMPTQPNRTAPLLDIAIILGCGLALMVLAGGIAPQSDTWWLLRAGQHIRETGQVPTAELWSFTAAGGPWPNHEWLAELLFALSYGVGGLAGVWCICAAAVVAAWLLIARTCEGPTWAGAALALIGAAGQQSAWSMRPQIFSIMLFGIALWLLPRKRLRWCYPPLFALWANLHAGIAYGGVVLAAAVAVAAWQDRAELPGWLLAAAASTLATLANPLGAGLWRYIVAAFTDPTRAALAEWQPPSLGNPSAYPFFGMAALWLICAVYVWFARPEPAARRMLLIGGVALLLASRSLRHSAVFFLAATPLLSYTLADLPPLRVARLRPQVLSGALAALAVACGIGTWAMWQRQGGHQPLSPAALAGVRACPGPMYNTYDDGGPLLWFAPGHRVLVDSRQDPYPGELLLAAARAEQRGTYRELFERYQITCALVPDGGALDAALRGAGWRELVRDSGRAVLLAP